MKEPDMIFTHSRNSSCYNPPYNNTLNHSNEKLIKYHRNMEKVQNSTSSKFSLDKRVKMAIEPKRYVSVTKKDTRNPKIGIQGILKQSQMNDREEANVLDKLLKNLLKKPRNKQEKPWTPQNILKSDENMDFSRLSSPRDATCKAQGTILLHGPNDSDKIIIKDQETITIDAETAKAEEISAKILNWKLKKNRHLQNTHEIIIEPEAQAEEEIKQSFNEFETLTKLSCLKETISKDLESLLAKIAPETTFGEISTENEDFTDAVISKIEKLGSTFSKGIERIDSLNQFYETNIPSWKSLVNARYSKELL